MQKDKKRTALTKEQRSHIMSCVPNKNTRIEVIFRKALWHRGIRYRKNYDRLPGKPDIAITKCKIAVFVDGDFWHARGHEEHPGEQVRSHQEYWVKHLSRNVERDKDVKDELTELGWLVLRFWESDIRKDLEKCVAQVCEYCGKA